MNDDVFELVEIEDGQIVLKRPNDTQALIKVDISADMAEQLSMSPLDFVRTMLEAGFSEAAECEDMRETPQDAALVYERTLH